MSQFNQPTYHVPKTSGICHATGRELQPGETMYACLVELTDEEHDRLRREHPNDPTLALGLRRIDVSQRAWQEGSRPEGLFSFWKTTVPEPNEKKKLFIDDTTLTQLLIRLDDAETPERLAFRFVLALILLRKKLLRYDREEKRSLEIAGETAERSCWLLTPKVDPAKGPLGKWDAEHQLVVVNPHLSEDDVLSVTDQLQEVLASEM
ncbi:MAG: hypothetical protein ACOC1G_02890 [Phycisphaeraceae bacterium]